MSFSELLANILNTVMVAVIPILVSFLVKRINIQTKNETINNYLTIAENAVSTAVQTISQTYVDALKSDGKFTAEEQKQAFEMAKTTAKQIMGDAALQAVDQLSHDSNGWLNAKIEAAVWTSK